MTTISCICGSRARLTDGKEIYPHRVDLYAKLFYKCDGCGGYVGCHPNTTIALGTPANAELRRERGQTHKAIDPIWRHAHKSPCYPRGFTTEKIKAVRRTARSRVYAYLAHMMGLEPEETHVGMFTIEQCQEARRVVRGVTYEHVRQWHKENFKQRENAA